MAERYQGRTYRTEDEVHGRPTHPSQSNASEGDPLAELARLIGQADPFAVAREQGARDPAPRRAAEPNIHSQPHSQPHGHSDEAGDEDVPPPPSWMQRVNQRRSVQPTAPSYPEEAHYRVDDAGHRGAAQNAQDYAEQGYDAQRYDDQSYDAQAEADYQAHGAAAYREDADPSRYDDALYGPAEGQQDSQLQLPPYPDTGYDHPSAYGEAYGAAYEEDEPRQPRRGGMVTVAAVVALAFVGTAGAYAYRTFTGSPRSGEAPIIKADPGPTKVVPQSQSADGSGKTIQDRVGAGAGGERMVSREEQPVDVNSARSGPRVVFPPLTANPNPAVVNPTTVPTARQSAMNSQASGNVGGDEPRKVRTLSIRPDQPDTAPSGTAAAPAAKPAAPAPRAAAAAPGSAANAPMPLSPQAPTRTASTSPTLPPQAATSGGYVVQISSQRSEADAQASYRSLQSKFPGVLGSRQPLIKRADLGDKGIYYRAMVGPFGSPEEASQFCGSLKSAGGQCVVQRN